MGSTGRTSRLRADGTGIGWDGGWWGGRGCVLSAQGWGADSQGPGRWVPAPSAPPSPAVGWAPGPPLWGTPLPPCRDAGRPRLPHPEYPLLHGGLHGLLQLLLGREVPRDGPADLGRGLLLYGPQSGLGTEKTGRDPLGSGWGVPGPLPMTLLVPCNGSFSAPVSLPCSCPMSPEATRSCSGLRGVQTHTVPKESSLDVPGLQAERPLRPAPPPGPMVS